MEANKLKRQSIVQISEQAKKNEVQLIKDQDIFYLFLNQKNNNIDFNFITKVNECLDIVENSENDGKDCCLVTIGSL